MVFIIIKAGYYGGQSSYSALTGPDLLLNKKVSVGVISPPAASVVKPILCSLYERDKLNPEFKVLT